MLERMRQATPDVERAPEPSPAVPRRRPGDERRALLAVGQAKLTVGAVSDPYEREADQVADRVMKIIQRMASGPPPVADVADHRCVASCVHRHAGHQHAGQEQSAAEVGADGGDLSQELTARIRRSYWPPRRWPSPRCLPGGSPGCRAVR